MSAHDAPPLLSEFADTTTRLNLLGGRGLLCAPKIGLNAIMTDDPKRTILTQGAREFHSALKDMLHAYDTAREHSKNRPVQTDHGKVAEAEFRKWLEAFLPKRYGVTPGFIISHAATQEEKLRHFDVIIYDALESPTLWVDNNSDSSEQGKSRAIPAEHVLAIMEVKATLNAKTAKDIANKLGELRPLLELDATNERYPQYLPRQFFCCFVCFEGNLAGEAVEAMLPDPPIRGYDSGLVLRDLKSDPPNLCASLRSIRHLPNDSSDATEAPSRYILNALNPIYFASESMFAIFAFDLLARLRGTFDPDRLSSMHVLGVRIRA